MPRVLAETPYLLVWALLLAVGAAMVASATVTMPGAYFGKHLAYVAVALVAGGVAVAVPLQVSRKLHRLALVAAVLCCALVLVPGVGHEVNGAQRWIRLGAVTFQASEAAKLLLLIYLAGYLERFGHLLGDRTWHMLRPLALVALVCFLLLLEPDFGSVVVLGLATCGLLFVAGARLRHFLLLLLVTGATLALLIAAQPYRLERLAVFVNPWASAFGSGYQLTQSLIAFGRGEWLGLGFGEGLQKLDYLPEAHNDFIFAVIAEETGIVGALAVMALFTVLVLLVFKAGRRAQSEGHRFGGYLCYGIGLTLAAQFLINLGVNTGALPTKGLTLPFVSYGGNSLIVCCVMMGLVVRTVRETNRVAAGRSGPVRSKPRD